MSRNQILQVSICRAFECMYEGIADSINFAGHRNLYTCFDAI